MSHDVQVQGNLIPPGVPLEVFTEIVKDLEFKEECSCALVCSAWNTAISSVWSRKRCLLLAGSNDSFGTKKSMNDVLLNVYGAQCLESISLTENVRLTDGKVELLKKFVNTTALGLYNCNIEPQEESSNGVNDVDRLENFMRSFPKLSSLSLCCINAFKPFIQTVISPTQSLQLLQYFGQLTHLQLLIPSSTFYDPISHYTFSAAFDVLAGSLKALILVGHLRFDQEDTEEVFGRALKGLINLVELSLDVMFYDIGGDKVVDENQIKSCSSLRYVFIAKADLDGAAFKSLFTLTELRVLVCVWNARSVVEHVMNYLRERQSPFYFYTDKEIPVAAEQELAGRATICTCFPEKFNWFQPEYEYDEVGQRTEAMDTKRDQFVKEMAMYWSFKAMLDGYKLSDCSTEYDKTVSPESSVSGGGYDLQQAMWDNLDDFDEEDVDDEDYEDDY